MAWSSKFVELGAPEGGNDFESRSLTYIAQEPELFFGWREASVNMSIGKWDIVLFRIGCSTVSLTFRERLTLDKA